jgi:hypothetical protein
MMKRLLTIVVVETDDKGQFSSRTYYDGLEFVAVGFATINGCLDRLSRQIADHNWRKTAKNREVI